MKVFADAWYYIALLNERDQHHDRAFRHAATLTSTQVTTRWVLAEVANLLSVHRTRAAVAALFHRLELSPFASVIHDSDDLFERGLALYERRPDKQWSLTDCISFVVMEQEGLREALTNDHHFTQAGYAAVFADAS